MDKYLYSDIIELISTQLSFEDRISLLQTCKKFYKLYKNERISKRLMLIEGNYKLSPIQSECVTKLLKSDNIISFLQAPMSSGKTAMILTYIFRKNFRAVIIVPPYVHQTWIQEFRKIYNEDKCLLFPSTSFPDHVEKLRNFIKNRYIPEDIRVILISSSDFSKYILSDRIVAKRIILSDEDKQSVQSSRHFLESIHNFQSDIKYGIKCDDQDSLYTIFRPNLIIFDEAHKRNIATESISIYELVRKNKNKKLIKLLFISATRIPEDYKKKRLLDKNEILKIKIDDNRIEDKLSDIQSEIIVKTRDTINVHQEIISNHKNKNKKIVIVNNLDYTSNLDIALDKSNVVVYDGKSIYLINKFNRNPDVNIFLSNIYRCSEGINLSSANELVIIGKNFSHKIITQVIGRLRRVTNKNKVIKIKLIYIPTDKKSFSITSIWDYRYSIIQHRYTNTKYYKTIFHNLLTKNQDLNNLKRLLLDYRNPRVVNLHKMFDYIENNITTIHDFWFLMFYTNFKLHKNLIIPIYNLFDIFIEYKLYNYDIEKIIDLILEKINYYTVQLPITIITNEIIDLKKRNLLTNN